MILVMLLSLYTKYPTALDYALSIAYTFTRLQAILYDYIQIGLIWTKEGDMQLHLRTCRILFDIISKHSIEFKKAFRHWLSSVGNIAIRYNANCRLLVLSLYVSCSLLRFSSNCNLFNYLCEGLCMNYF
jgi:hypothetical protein